MATFRLLLSSVFSTAILLVLTTQMDYTKADNNPLGLVMVSFIFVPVTIVLWTVTVSRMKANYRRNRD